jgi:dihydroxyacetone kinase-like protein
MSCTAATTTTAVRAAAAAVAEHRSELTQLDREIGDGDHGENLGRGFAAVLTKLEGASPDTPAAVLQLVATTLITTVGGASGPLFGTAFLRAATALADRPAVDGPAVVAALTAARDGVIARGKADPGDKTMVDALAPAVTAAAASAADGGDAAAVLAAAADGATQGAAATVPMQARKGRASYLGERSTGHPDPGATSVGYVLGAIAQAAAQG